MFTRRISPDWIESISAWAGKIDEVERAWIYSSFARGTATCWSDLDIGLGLQGSDGEGPADWCLGKSEWETQLQKLLPVRLHLELADPVHSPDRVWPSIQRDGIKVFERGSSQETPLPHGER